MAWETVFNTIRSRFTTQVADVLSLQTQYDNQKFDNPDNANWCRFTIIPGDTEQKTIGAPSANVERTVGVAVAQLFGPLHAGDGDLLEIADSVRTAFKRVTVSGVVFGTPKLRRIGKKADSWQVNVVCPFRVDEIG